MYGCTIRRPTATGTLVGRERIELPEGIPPVLQTGPLPSTVYLPMLVSDCCINQTYGTPTVIRTLIPGLEDRCTIPCAMGAWCPCPDSNRESDASEAPAYTVPPQRQAEQHAGSAFSACRPQMIPKGACSFGIICDGTHGRTRTSNLPVNGRLLYRLSYTGVIKLSCQVARRIKRIVRFCRAILNISLGLFVPKQSQINIVTAQWVHCSSPNTDSCQVWISRQKNAVNRTFSFGAH